MISSTSSCVCDCGGYQYVYSLDRKHGPEAENQWVNGFYPNVGQPLVYYAQVQHTKTPWNMEGRKLKPNYFSNAFHWYNKSHDHPKKKNGTDINSFAVWLDGKYEEFLRESDRGQPRLDPKKTSTLVTAKMSSIATNKTKRERRWRSPWKRRRTSKNNERDAHYVKPKQSFEYLLPPKELNQTTSEYYQLNPPNFTNRSNATTATGEICNSANNSGKSQSMSNIHYKDFRQPTDFNNPPDGAGMKYNEYSFIGQEYSYLAQERPHSEEEIVNKNHTCICPNVSSSTMKPQIIEEKSEVKSKKPRFDDVSCQCYVETYAPMSDAHLQQENITWYNNDRNGLDPYPEKVNKKSGESLPPEVNKGLPAQGVLYNVKLGNAKSPNSYTILVNERNQSCKLLLNDGAQTSDHSIDLERDVAEHARVLKIYCAEKVSK